MSDPSPTEHALTRPEAPRSPSDAATYRSSRPPPQLPVSVQILDQLGDIVGIIALTVVCLAGKLPGETTAVAILLTLGVQTGLRGGLARANAPRGGALVLLVTAATPWLSGGHAGFLRVPRFWRSAARFLGLTLACALAMLVGCPRWQRPGCESPGRYECRANQPHYCGASRQLTPVGDQPCGAGEACALDPQGTAHCAREGTR